MLSACGCHAPNSFPDRGWHVLQDRGCDHGLLDAPDGGDGVQMGWTDGAMLSWCTEKRRHSNWTHWDLNPGPSACGADVIPLHHVPSDGIEFHTMNPNFGAPVDFSHGPLSMIKKGQAQKSFRQAGLDDDRGR